jgi:predicted acyltransferase
MEKPNRLLALDVFRGLTIAMMVVVNNPGSWKYVYSPLRHSEWHGCTPTDLVFPFFMFIMGAAMWYSFKKFKHSLSKPMLMKILRRTVVIFLIGLAVNMFASFSFNISHLRIMGVMNRIALGYGIAAFIILGLRYNYVRLVTGIILLLYWALLVIFGGEAPFSLEGNFAGKFDLFVLGANHMQGFHGVTFDQSGLLASLPSVAHVLLGYITGRLIDQSKSKMHAVKLLAIYGISGVLIGIAWGYIFPINKPLWTSSFVVYTSGLAMLLLGLFLWIIDIKGFKKWTHPLRVFGMNPLFLYVFSVFLAISLRIKVAHSISGEMISISEWLYTRFYQALAGNMIGSLLYALSFGILCWLIGWVLYRKKIYIKI